MHEEIEVQELKLQNLYENLERANDLVKELEEDKENIQADIERLEADNRLLIEENESLQHHVNKTQRSLLIIKQSPEIKSKNYHIRRSLTMTFPIVEEKLASETEEEIDSLEEVSNDPNIENYLKQLKELKHLCKDQGKALTLLQETMESTRSDTDRLHKTLLDLESAKKHKLHPGSLANINPPTNPFQTLSFNSSMFISSLEDPISDFRHKRSLSSFRNPRIITTAFLSHISALPL